MKDLQHHLSSACAGHSEGRPMSFPMHATPGTSSLSKPLLGSQLEFLIHIGRGAGRLPHNESPSSYSLLRKWVNWSAGAVITEYQRLGDLHNGKLFSHSSGG